MVIATTRGNNGGARCEAPGFHRGDVHNADPEIIDYPIAGNDDAIRAIRVMLQKLVDAIVSAGADARVREQVEMAGVSA